MLDGPVPKDELINAIHLGGGLDRDHQLVGGLDHLEHPEAIESQ
jgi:hypothetical protein